MSNKYLPKKTNEKSEDGEVFSPAAKGTASLREQLVLKHTQKLDSRKFSTPSALVIEDIQYAMPFSEQHKDQICKTIFHSQF
jgi:hypothetical protein